MIEFEDVSYSYCRRAKIIDRMTLSFTQGHIHGLFGCNGTGKTTLLKLACGLLSPAKGRVEIDGMVSMKRPSRLFQNLIFVPEEFFLPSVRCSEFVKRTSVFYPNFSHDDFDCYSKELSVEKNMNLSKMSMGQRKKAYIAFALATGVKQLILDEPTNGLDIPSKASLRQLLAAYASPERTVVISTHQVRDLENLIDNVVIIDHQGVVINASVDEISHILHFGECADPSTAIYSEKSIEGTLCVSPNTAGRDSRISLELLFGASISARGTICEMFNK